MQNLLFFSYDFYEICRSWLDNVLLNLDQTKNKENHDYSNKSEKSAFSSYMFKFTKIMPLTLDAAKFLNFPMDQKEEEFKQRIKNILERLKGINELINEDDVYELLKQINFQALNQKQKIWSSLKRNKTKSTTIKIEFYDPHFGEFSFIASDSSNSQKDNSPFFLDVILKKTKVNHQELWQKIIEYFQECFSPFDFNKRKPLINRVRFLPWEKIESNLIEMLRTIGLERTTEILKIVDPSIKSINYESFCEKFTSVFSFNNYDGTVTPIEYLSSGTKRFVYIINVILKITNNSKNCDGFIVIDELESYLHVSLTRFIKEIIYGLNPSYQIQLFFSSHSPIILTELLSNKQIYVVGKENKKSYIKKMSSITENEVGIIKKLIDQTVGSHPDMTQIDYVLDQILSNCMDKKDY